MLFPDTYEVNAAGHMAVGGCDLGQLATEFGTPLYVYDEATFRARIAEYPRGWRRCTRVKPWCCTRARPSCRWR